MHRDRAPSASSQNSPTAAGGPTIAARLGKVDRKPDAFAGRIMHLDHTFAMTSDRVPEGESDRALQHHADSSNRSFAKASAAARTFRRSYSAGRLASHPISGPRAASYRWWNEHD